MFRNFFMVLVLVLLTAIPAIAADKIILLEISASEDPTVDKIWLGFSKQPAYEVKVSGSKVELFLPGVVMGPAVQELPAHGSIVSYYIINKDDGILLTFVLARQPVRVDSSWGKRSFGQNISDSGVTPREGLELDISWSEKHSGFRPAIAFSLPGVRTVRNGAVASLSMASSYKGRWQRFFADYEDFPRLSIPLHYIIPPFPFLAVETVENEHQKLVTAIGHIKRREWQKSLAVLRKVMSEQQPDGNKYTKLLYGESLVRAGAFEEGEKVLSEWLNNHPSSSEESYVRYLIIYAKASAGETYSSAYELAELLRSANLGRILPYCRLLQAELFLATEQPDKALRILKDEKEIYKDFLKNIHDLRLADALTSTGYYESALRYYQQLQGSGEMASLIEDRFFSRACFAYALYQRRAYSLAAEHYEVLATSLESIPVQQGLVLYSLAVARQKSGSRDTTLINDIVTRFPDTEAYYRARLKQSDWGMLSAYESNWDNVLLQYNKIAVNTPFRNVREEAAFKAALVNYLIGERLRCVEQLQVFLRNYSRGPLLQHAESLLVEAVPLVIEELVDKEEYLKALVLAEQSRKFLLSGQISDKFLGELAVAFSRLCLFDRAARVYRFLLEVSRGKPEEESRYLPLITVLYDKEDYELVEEYGKQYAGRFPEGNDSLRIRLLRAEALYRSGELEKAVHMLSQGKTTGRELNSLAGRIFWELGEYDKVEKYLAGTMDSDMRNAMPREVFIRAESLFMSSNGQQAQPLYHHLFTDDTYGDQAKYRAAQVYFMEGRESDGLKLLQRLVEEGNNPLWRRIAEEDIAIRKL
jgi:outer membrane protein assembly factor BamD (BamD/ComL family)